MMLRVLTVVPGQRFTSQSSIFSTGGDLCSLGGTIGRSKGPLGTGLVGAASACGDFLIRSKNVSATVVSFFARNERNQFHAELIVRALSGLVVDGSRLVVDHSLAAHNYGYLEPLR
jgi:hypothetical protein